MASFQNNNTDIRKAICQGRHIGGECGGWADGAEKDGAQNQMLRFLKIDMLGLQGCQVPPH